MDRPRRLASDYASEPHERVRSTLLYVATCLGDMIDDLVVVGGLVPSLLIRESELPDGAAPHVGTMDLDLGLTLGLLNDARYQGLISRLRDAGFRCDANPRGNPAHQRWTMAEPISATVDFLIPPSLTDDPPGKLKHLAPDFAAIVTPGLSLAFRDRERVSVSGRTPRNEKATRDVWVCGPGAFVVLKALAFKNRGLPKDAYDLYFIVRYFGANTQEVIARLVPLLDDPEARRAVAVLEADFRDPESTGPRRVAEFLFGRADSETEADVVGFIDLLLLQCRRHDPKS